MTALSRSTSKLLLVVVIIGGLAAIAMGYLASLNNLIGFALILTGAIWNRIDSRARGYRFALSAGGANVTIETAPRGANELP